MRINVIGSIGREGETNRIEFVASELRLDGHDVVTSLDNRPYNQKDWREDFAGAKEHFEQMKRSIKNGDFDIVVADLSAPSDGRTNEQVLLKALGLRIIGFTLVPVHSPWRLVLADEIYNDISDLKSRLKEIEAGNTLIDEHGFIHAPRSGVIRETLVKDRQGVQKGQTLLVMHSVETDYEIKAPISGHIRLINKTNIRVAFGDELMFIAK